MSRGEVSGAVAIIGAGDVGATTAKSDLCVPAEELYIPQLLN